MEVDMEAVRGVDEPDQMWELSDAEFGLILALGLAIGIPLMFGVVLVIALAAGTSLAVALIAAATPAVVAGPYLGGLLVLGRIQDEHEHPAHVQKGEGTVPRAA